MPVRVLVPAFMLSELRAAFVAGFIMFLPFLLIDLGDPTDRVGQHHLQSFGRGPAQRWMTPRAPIHDALVTHGCAAG